MYLFFGLIFVFGLVIGSFLNCLIWRLYSDETVLGRSYCPECRKQISWFDNIPILSFLLLRGKCRSCHKKISWQYPLVELSTGFLFVLAFYVNTISGFSALKLLFDLFLISILIIIFIFDLRWMVVPIKAIGISSLVLLLINLFLGFSPWQIFATLLAGVAFLACSISSPKAKVWVKEIFG